jgi:hypothetical protein
LLPSSRVIWLQTWPERSTWPTKPHSSAAGSALSWLIVSPKLARVSSVPACGL